MPDFQDQSGREYEDFKGDYTVSAGNAFSEIPLGCREHCFTAAIGCPMAIGETAEASVS